MEVFLSVLAETKLLDLTDYLQKKWGELKGLYKCVVSKQSTFYYRINFDLSEIEIITIFDTRQNPSKLKDETQNH